MMGYSISGNMRAGKDKVLELMQKHSMYKQMAFGDKLKQFAHQVHPNIPKHPKPRKLYQDFGQSQRAINPDIWVQWLVNDLVYNYHEDTIVITDTRQPNEFDMLKKLGFVMVGVIADDDVRLKRINEKGEKVSQEEFFHETEVHIQNYDYDFVIHNNGTLEELEQQVLKLVATYEPHILR